MSVRQKRTYFWKFWRFFHTKCAWVKIFDRVLNWCWHMHRKYLTKSFYPENCKNCPCYLINANWQGSFCNFLGQMILSSTFLKNGLYLILTKVFMVKKAVQMIQRGYQSELWRTSKIILSIYSKTSSRS